MHAVTIMVQRLTITCGCAVACSRGLTAQNTANIAPLIDSSGQPLLALLLLLLPHADAAAAAASDDTVAE
jgi:hypothetical protein